MSKFKVGDRVRIIYSNGWPGLAGETGVIIGISDDRGVLGDSEWDVSVDSWGGQIAPYPSLCGAMLYAPSSRQLEPILYNGAQPSEFSYSELMDNLRTKVQEEV